MRLNLFSKLLILLAVPVTLQLLAIVYFNQIYSEIGSNIRYQNVAMDAVRKVSKLARLMVDMVGGANKGQIEQQNNGTASGFVGSIAEMQDDLEQLRGAGEPYPELVACTKTISVETKKTINHWMDAALDGKRPSLKTVSEFKYLSDLWNEKTQWLMSRPARVVLDQYLRTNRVHDAILLATVSIILANIIVAVWISSVMRRHIVRHVSRLEENFDRLAKNRPLLAPLKGNDEIAEFDRAFHDIVKEVAASRLERQDYLRIMNSTMRKPLVELETFLEDVHKSDSSTMSEKGKTSLTSTSTTIKRLVAMLNELIDFDQIEQGNLALAWKSISAQEIIDNAISCVEFRANDAKITIRKELQEIAFQADPDRLVQVLINLLTNAIKFSPAQSVITVSAVRNERDVLISVQDEGRGIPADKLDKVFLRFEQVDQSDSKQQKGSGLGLAICTTIVEAHGGEIWAENNAAQGARFSFSIPATDMQEISKA